MSFAVPEPRLEPETPTPAKELRRDMIDSLAACLEEAEHCQGRGDDFQESLMKLAPPKEVIDAWNIITGWLLTAMGAWAAEKRDLEDREEGYSPC